MTRTAKVLLFCVNLVVAANFATAATTDNYVAAITGSGVQVNLTGAAGKPLANVSSTTNSLVLDVGTLTIQHRRLDGAGQNANGSGAMEVGVYDDNLANTTHTILQQVLKDFDTAITAGAALQNIFQTIDAPAGTDPVADSPTDTLAIFTDAFIGITGSSAADSLTFLLAATVTRDAEWDTQAEVETIWGVTLATDAEVAAGYVPVTRTVSTTTPLAGGGALSANLTLSIANGAADGSTLGAVAGTAADFNATSGVLSIDYTNGQKATTSVPGFLTAADWTTFNGKQAGDAMLTALSALTTATGDVLYFTGADAPALLADVATGNVILSGGVTTAPAYGKVGLTTHVTGTLPVANGGTGFTALSSLFANPSATINGTAVNGSATTALRSDGAPALADPLTPADGTQNIAGALQASVALYTPELTRTTGGNLSIGTTAGSIILTPNSGSISLPLVSSSRALITDSSSNLVASTTVSDTELGYLDGVTSALQTQIAGLQPLDADLTDLAGLTAVQGDVIYGNGAGDWAKLAKDTGGIRIFSNQGTSNSPTWSAGSVFTANPSATIGGTVANGSATTFMRSDGAPALATSITPGANYQTWTKNADAGTGQEFSNTNTGSSAYVQLHLINNAVADNSGIWMMGSGNTQYSGASSIAIAQVGNRNIGFVTNNSLRAIILGTGEIGIGDATPDAPLEVVGNVFVSATAGGDGDLAKFQSGGLTLAGNLILPAVGNGITVKEGTNARMGVATLVGGTATVANTSVTANSRIFLTANTAGGTVGALYVSARTAGTSFVISSLSLVDTSTVAWFIMEPS